MTQTKLCSKLISLLLALAMIAAFIPAISHTAAAAGDPPLSNLNADNYLYGDGWTWDGQTLHFYGSRTFDLKYINFFIESTKNGGAAVIDIASSINVTGSYVTDIFINAIEVPLEIRGAGKIEAVGKSTLFSTSKSIEYAGGAITSNDNTRIFDCNALTITQGYIEAPESVILMQSADIKNSYIAINGFKDSFYVLFNANIKIDRSCVEVASLISNTSDYHATKPQYTLTNSVLCSSKTEVSEFFSASSPQFVSIKNSVVYLPKLVENSALNENALPGTPVKHKVTSGGYVFCNKVLTDNDRTNTTDLDGNTASVGNELSGVFYDNNQSTTGALNLKNVKLTGGNLFICPNNLTANTNVQAENATLAFVSNGYNRDVDLCGYSKASFNSCTIVSTNDNTEECHISIDAPYTDKCNIYSNATGLNDTRSIYVSCDYNIKTENNFYAPNGNINIRPQFDNIYANICAKKLKNLANTFVFHGNVYADSLVYSKGCIFDGSGDYEVNLLSNDNYVEFDSPLIYVHEKSGADWVYTEIQPDENGDIKYAGTNEIYAGGMVLNPIAGSPVFSNPMNVSVGSPATVKVPLTYPFSNGTLDLDISLHDEDGNYTLDWNDIGVTPKILNTGGEKEFTLSLEANSGAKAGTYFFYLNINGQKIKDSSGEIFFNIIVNYAKISFYHEFFNFSVGSDDSPTNYYTVSAEYNGSPLVKQGTGIGSYYTVPVGEYFDITLIPKDGYSLEIEYDSDFIPPSLNGSYHLPADSDRTITLRMTKTGDTSYYALDLSAELQKSLADGEISSVTVKYSDGTEKTFDGKSTDFSTMVLRNEKVTVSIAAAEGCSVAKINGADAVYDSKKATYSTDITVSDNTTVNAAVYKADELCTLELSILNISLPGDKVTVTPAPVNAARSEYEIGTECEIVATITDDKFIGTSEFNGAHIDAYSLESDGCHYKVKLDKGANKFFIYYADLSVLRIPKPANGSVTFSGRLDGGRSFETLSDGTQVYNIGSWDEVTLTLTPDSGYRVKSAELNGKDVTVTNNACTFTIEQLVDWTFNAEFEEIQAGSAALTVISGEHGTVTPATSDYPIGTEVTLTVTPDSGYRVKSAALDGKNVTLTGGKYTFTITADCTFSAEFERKSSGGGSARPNHNCSSDVGTNQPAINGAAKDWAEIAADLEKLSGTITIDLNGSTTVPADVIKALKDRKITAIFRVDNIKSWTVNGAQITAVSAAELGVYAGVSTAQGARGVVGYRFSTNNTGLNAALNVSFKAQYAGQFANLYYIKDGKAEFAGTAKISADGSVALPVNGKGEYVVMLCKYSDLAGDADNDGEITIKDALAALRHAMAVEDAANSAVADFNGDGKISIEDALAILKYAFNVKEA